MVGSGDRRDSAGGIAAVLAVVVAAVLVLIGSFVLARINVERQLAEQPAAPNTGREGEPVQAIGPLPGTVLATYKTERDQDLRSAEGDRLAVVSLIRYVTEAEARVTVGQVAVVGLLAALPGGEQSLVTTGLPAWVEEQRRAAITERDGLRSQLATTDSPEFQQAFRADIDRLERLIRRARPDGPLVFGLVVRAPAATLQGLANRAGVRLVDVGSSATPAPNVRYRGVKPEETVKADQPQYRPG